ncbi:unnamed protein product [Schistosoma mattheei]|uniref:Uncharacterized protein n=1 Tax=Schistosoma mattheei TaxID=31246 RepID=A0A3P7YBZ0_9TREM|nr:unnamed protein product [Schistosoma mattheei]
MQRHRNDVLGSAFEFQALLCSVSKLLLHSLPCPLLDCIEEIFVEAIEVLNASGMLLACALDNSVFLLELCCFSDCMCLELDLSLRMHLIRV